MDGIGDYLQKKSAKLGLDRAHTLRAIQQRLDNMFPGECRAVSIQDGVLRVTTPNASVAGELRFRKAELKTAEVKKVVIQIR